MKHQTFGLWLSIAALVMTPLASLATHNAYSEQQYAFEESVLSSGKYRWPDPAHPWKYSAAWNATSTPLFLSLVHHCENGSGMPQKDETGDCEGNAANQPVNDNDYAHKFLVEADGGITLTFTSTDAAIVRLHGYPHEGPVDSPRHEDRYSRCPDATAGAFVTDTGPELGRALSRNIVGITGLQTATMTLGAGAGTWIVYADGVASMPSTMLKLAIESSLYFTVTPIREKFDLIIGLNSVPYGVDLGACSLFDPAGGDDLGMDLGELVGAKLPE